MAFTLWPNIILFVCVGIVVSIVGYIIYGYFVGFENTLKDFENDELRCETEEERHCQLGERKDEDK
jgi:hypothetical protein